MRLLTGQRSWKRATRVKARSDMSRLRLRHLTFIGAVAEPASVEFSPHVTVIRGPSDTGKSFIVDAIDFMLGANPLKEIPERTGYSTALLGLELPQGEVVTLSRSVNGGNIGLHRGDVRTGPLGVPVETLAAKHSATSEKNLSRYLLAQIDLDGKRVRKNARNITDSLSFRNLAHLCIVDETQMQSETQPPLSGAYVSKTKEISVLKLLLQDEDDGALVPIDSKQEATKLSSAKIGVIDRLLAELEGQLSDHPAEADLMEQLQRLDVAIEDQTRSIAALTDQRSEVAEALRTAQDVEASTRHDLADTVALRARFDLLHSQYDSDLERLGMLREAGTLLGYFRSGVCVFCGAEPEHQHYNEDREDDSTAFGESVEAETRKTLALRDDLTATIADLEIRAAELSESATDTRTQIEQLQGSVRGLDDEIKPRHGDLRLLINSRSEVQRSLATYAQVANLERMKLEIADEVAPEAAAAASGLELGTLSEFSDELSRRLADWGFPEAASVRYDRREQDIIAGDQLRSAHGKGVRAILHAAFTLGLAQYCIDRDIPHPGFVVLDSPLVTYRPPEPGDVRSPDEENLPQDVVGAFYRDIQQRFDGQAIVMENTDPPDPLNEETVDIVFTKAWGSGRYGYFPVQ